MAIIILWTLNKMTSTVLWCALKTALYTLMTYKCSTDLGLASVQHFLEKIMYFLKLGSTLVLVEVVPAKSVRGSCVQECFLEY